MDVGAALMIVVPLLAMGTLAGSLIRAGTSAADMSDAARQKLVGLGMILLYVTIPCCIVAVAFGGIALSRN